MNIIMTLKMALKSIISNKLRTFLTMLGIIIGVSSVIIMVSLGEGTTVQIKENIESMGSNQLTINIRGSENADKISYDEIINLKGIKGVKSVSPIINSSSAIKYGSNTVDSVTMYGVNEEYQTVQGYELSQGRFIVPLDIEGRQKVVVLGSDTADELFEENNPIGENIKVNGTDYTVVGILESKGSSFGQSKDEVILIPISTAIRALKSSGIQTIYVQAESPDTVDEVEAELESFLLGKLDNDEDNYRLFNQTDMLETLDEVTQTMALMLGGIAGISLIVGGIGIMNIMLVSVTERTREIGIRKAIGAKRRSILVQFLIESSVISGFGGIIGVIGSYIIIYLLQKYASLTASTPLYIVLIAFSFSLAVGIFFGLYPANKASKLKPVDALRYE